MDKKLSNYIGRMLEIKCPYCRVIQTEGEVYGGIVPEYYWAQVQGQLEVCELDECDFWQCTITEYPNREAFIEDTDDKILYKSKEHQKEKGCVIQLLPKTSINDENTKYAEKVLYAKYIYPPRIAMSFREYDEWVLETINNIWKLESEYVFDRVIYWKLTVSHNVTIERDVAWFNKNLPKIEETWKYIEYYRANQEKLDDLCKYIETMKYKRDQNTKIISYIQNDINNVKTKIDSKIKKKKSPAVKKTKCMILTDSDE